MADGERRGMRQRGNPVSYKEPGELKISLLEGKKEEGKKPVDEDNSSDEEDDSDPISRKKFKGPRSVSQKRRVSAPKASSKLQVRHSIDGGEGLLEIISHKPSAIPMAVKQWWSDFDKEPATAVGKLTNMMIEACGLSERLPDYAFSDDDDKDVDEYIQALVEKCTLANGDSVVSQNVFDKKDKASKKIQANFSDFWDKFVMHAPEVELRNLHEHPFCPWLHAMSTAQLKVLRQVATSVGMDMMLGVVSKTGDAIKSMTNFERLHETACNNKNSKEIERTKEQLESKREICKDSEQCILSFFNSIFVHRYKDSHAEVRAKCVQTIGKLVLEYTTKFLDNSYLKYIGWALYDKDKEVRLVALEAIDAFYNSSLIANLEAFTTRFRGRVLQMRYDVDKDVQIRALEAAKTMGVKDLLSDEEGLEFREHVYQMITEEDADIRSAAAGFIQAIYIDTDLKAEYAKSKKKAGKNALDQDVYMVKGIVELLNVVAAGYDDMHPIMEPLLNELTCLESLDMLCDVMMEEEGEDCLDEDQKATLGKMILGITATLSELCESDDSGQRLKKKNNPSYNKCKDATLVLGDKLPKMMKYFAADVATLTPLVGTLEHFMLDVFNAKDSTIKDIVEAVVDIFKKANEDDLLETCAIALEHFSSATYSAKSAVEALIKNLIKGLATDFKKVCDTFEKGSKLSSQQSLALKRMMIMAGRCDVFKAENSIRTHAVKMLEAVAQEDSSIAPESACHVMMIVQNYLSWRIETKVGESANMFEAKEELVSCCKALLERGSGLNALLRAHAVSNIADCQHLLGRHLTDEERPKDLEMTKVDIEDLLPSVDGNLSRGADAFGLDADIAKTISVVNRVFSDSEDDPHGNMRLQACALLKAVIYQHMESEEFVCEMLSTLTLHKPYPAKFHQELLKMLQEHLESREDQGEFWKNAHTRMCMRIAEEMMQHKPRKVTDEMFAAMVESVGNLKLKNKDITQYVRRGIEWVMEEWKSTRAAFLDAIHVQTKKLDREQISSILSTFDDLCRAQRVPLETPIDEAEGTLPAILKFRQYLHDRRMGNQVAGQGRPRARTTKSRLTFTPSGTPMSSQASGGKGSSNKAKRKSRQLGSDDEDEDGWVAAPSASSRASSQTGSAGKKRR